MKNKLKFLLPIFFLWLFIVDTSAFEDFVFESKSIEIDNNNNIIAKDGVKVTTSDGLEIYANNSEYEKNSKILILNKNVKILDNNRNYEINSDNIIYNKLVEKITSKTNTIITVDNSHKIYTENIIFFRSKLKIQSDEPTTIKDKFNNEIKLSGFSYSIKDKIIRTNKMEYVDKDGNVYKSKNAFVDLGNEKLAAKDIQVYFADGELGENARLKGSSLISENNISIIKNGIFTACKIRDECPPWTLKSKEIKHDKNKKTINYKDSWLQLYDIPIFYFPKFFHPDPTVKRQSGFLPPTLLSSSTSGGSINIPYYKVISENKDTTFTPRIYFNDDFSIQNEYRQVEKNTKHISDLSLKKLDHSTKSHFFSNTKHNLDNNFDFSEIELNLEKTSSDTYLKGDNIVSKTRNRNNQSLLNSYIKFDASREDLNIFAELAAYEDLTKEKDSDKFQYVFPNFTISKLLNNKTDIKGNLNYKISGSSQKRNTNVSESFLINDLVYKSNSFFSKFGSISNYELKFKNSLKKGKNSDKYKKDTQSENFSAFVLSSYFPLKKKYEDYIGSLIPKISARFSPNKSENLSDLDRKINITNIFSKNRLGLNDSVEGGQSLTLGFDYNLKTKNNDDFLNFSLGQIYKDTEDKRLPIKSKMQNKSSDIVGNFDFQPQDNFKINYDFSFDNNLDTVNYTKIETQLSINNFVTSFDFLEEANEIGSDSYLLSDIKYNFDKNNIITYNTRRNRKTDLTEYYNLLYQYKNDCLVAGIEYNKEYYQDRDLKPTEQIFFSLTFTPFTSIATPSF
tara:strand:- start:4319 stop:6694 length:2376 start_codon:yes stop_codon:yes gene_type:complete